MSRTPGVKMSFRRDKSGEVEPAPATLPETLLAAITTATSDAVLTTDEDGIVVSANPAAERLFGWSRGELIGRSWLALRPGTETVDQRARFLQLVEQMLDEGRPATTQLQHREGAIIEVECTLTRAGGGIVLIARDVTGQRELAEAAREQSQRIASLASAQSQIAAGGPSPRATMELVASAACRLVGASGAAIQLPDGEHLIFRGGVGVASSWSGRRVRLTDSIGGDAYQAGQITTATREQLLRDLGVVEHDSVAAAVQSLLAVPLREGGTPTSVLLVAHSQAAAFDERDLRLLELFSGMAASVLHRSQVEHALAVAHAVAQAANVDATLESGLSGALRVLTGRLGWEAAAIWLESDDADNSLCCEAHLIDSGMPAQSLQASLARVVGAADGSPLWASFAGGGPLWLDLSTEQGGRPGSTPARELGFAAAAYVPMHSHGRVIGVIELLQRRARAHDAEDLALLETVAAQIANFIARRRAEAQMAVQTQNLSAVVALSQMLATVPVAHVRQALCDSIQEVAESDVVALYEPAADGALVVSAQAGDTAPQPEPVAVGAASLVAEVLRSGSGGFLSGSALDGAADDELVLRTGMRSGHIEPVLRDGTVVAVLAVVSRSSRPRALAGLGELMKLLAAEAATTLALADLVHVLDARARTDELTGLPNRRTWDEELPRELARSKRGGKPIAVAMLDLDHFKRYNDSFGHPAGDRLLRAVAAGWGSRLRETDLLARYGGEEFGVVLPGCDLQAASQVLDELRICMPDGTTCSIGVAVWDGAESHDELVCRADQALYEAKRAGRDRIAAATT